MHTESGYHRSVFWHLLASEILEECWNSYCTLQRANKSVLMFRLAANLKAIRTFRNTGRHKKKGELLKNPTKIEEIRKKKILTEIESLHDY